MISPPGCARLYRRIFMLLPQAPMSMQHARHTLYIPSCLVCKLPIVRGDPPDVPWSTWPSGRTGVVNGACRGWRVFITTPPCGVAACRDESAFRELAHGPLLSAASVLACLSMAEPSALLQQKKNLVEVWILSERERGLRVAKHLSNRIRRLFFHGSCVSGHEKSVFFSL